MHDADVVFLDGFNDGQRIPFPARHQEAQSGALHRPPEQFPHRHVEIVGRLLQDDVALIDRVGVLHPVQAVDEGAVLDHHSLGFAGRSGSINHIRQILRLVDDDWVGCRPAVNVRIVEIDDQSPSKAIRAGGPALHQQYLDAGILQHVVDAIRRIVRWKGR